MKILSLFLLSHNPVSGSRYVYLEFVSLCTQSQSSMGSNCLHTILRFLPYAVLCNCDVAMAIGFIYGGNTKCRYSKTVDFSSIYFLKWVLYVGGGVFMHILMYTPKTVLTEQPGIF